MIRRRSKNKRKKRNSNFSVYPLVKVRLDNPPRLAMVYWGKGRPKEYRLDYLNIHELRNFWRMNKSEMAEYLKKFFNRHHRKPRCQKGQTTIDNLSYVDIVSHTCYNSLIAMVARWSSISIENVHTEHMENFIRQFYHQLEKLLVENNRLKSMDTVLHVRNLSNVGSHLKMNIAKWAGLDPNVLHVSDVKRFFEKIYYPLIRLAYDHEQKRLKSMHSFMKLLNEIWLPTEEQIALRH